MYSAGPLESRRPKEKRLRNVLSKPLRPITEHVFSSEGRLQTPQWNQSAVSLAVVPVTQAYPPNYAYVQQQPPPASNAPVQRHNRASTTNLPTMPVIPFPDNDYTMGKPSESDRDIVGNRLSEIISMIDEESYPEAGREIVISIPGTPPPAYSHEHHTGSDRSVVHHKRPARQSQSQTRSVNILTKLSYYSNSRLPTELPPFRAYIPTYPLLCLAALCSANAYNYRQNSAKNEQLISADTRIGTKAMVIKSVTCADEKTIVIAIRGTSVLSLKDWNVNLNTTPESPVGFLDDDGNYCHAGFLRVAKAMVKPVARHLRHLLEENPNRLSFSLLITGHSAGGAVASLLYAHILSEHVKSELTILTDCFKRVHCVTFGAPPISLLPLRKPPNKEHQLRKSMFHSFINEGDPVVRAEKSYVLSLVDLLTTTNPSAASLLSSKHANSDSNSRLMNLPTASMSMLRITNLGLCMNPNKQRSHNSLPLPPRPTAHASSGKPTWTVPPSTLSNAGRLVVLRGPEPPPKASMSQIDLTKEFEEVKAYTVTDEQIRQVIFGDPMMHAMDVYRRRIEALAMKAVTGRDKYY